MGLGQALGIAVSGHVSLWALFLGLLFTIGDGLFIVWLNDWADEGVDRIKRARFPDGCSPKTIPDGILPARTLLLAGLAAGASAMLTALAACLLFGLAHAPALAALCLGIFAAYTLPPLRLNYRGGGELLEMVGVGVALPLFNAYLQSGTLWDARYELLIGWAALSLASALASGLSDEESDREGGKTTFTTLLGNAAVRRATLASLSLGGLLLWLITWRQRALLPMWSVALAATCISLHQWRMIELGDAPHTNAFKALGTYKLHLHRGIWGVGLVLTLGLVLHALFGAGGL